MIYKSGEIQSLLELIVQLKGENVLRMAIFDANGAILALDEQFPGFNIDAKDYFQNSHPAIVTQIEPFFKSKLPVKRKVFRCFVPVCERNTELFSFEVLKLNWQNHLYILLLQRKPESILCIQNGLQQMLNQLGLFVFDYDLISNHFIGAQAFFARCQIPAADSFTLQQFIQLIKSPAREQFMQIIENTINFGEKAGIELELRSENKQCTFWLGVMTVADAWPTERITFIAKDTTEAKLLQQEARIFQLISKSTGLKYIKLPVEGEAHQKDIVQLIQQHIELLKNKEVVSLVDVESEQEVKNVDLIPLFNAGNKLSSIILTEKNLQRALDRSGVRLIEKTEKYAELEALAFMVRKNGKAAANTIASQLGNLINADAIVVYETGSKKSLWKNIAEWRNPGGSLPLNGLPEAYNPALYADFTRKIAMNGHEPCSLHHQSATNEKMTDAKEWLLDEMGFADIIWLPLMHKGDTHMVAECWFKTSPKKSCFEYLHTLSKLLASADSDHVHTHAELEQLRNELNQKDLLIKEVNHRAKNNLALIAGLLKIQASTLNDPAARAALKESQARIKSIALLHEELYQKADERQSIQLDHYLKRLIDNISNGFGKQKIDIQTELIPVSLPSRKVVTIGLLVNEIVTNAFKHGLKDVSDGKIRVSLSQTGEKLTLHISDNGPGYAPDFNPDTLDSLGFTLIREFSEQLGGNWKFYSDNGANFSITFTLHNT